MNEKAKRKYLSLKPDLKRLIEDTEKRLHFEKQTDTIEFSLEIINSVLDVLENDDNKINNIEDLDFMIQAQFRHLNHIAKRNRELKKGS